jgi:hypothetical protein
VELFMLLRPYRTSMFLEGVRCKIPVEVVAANGGKENKAKVPFNLVIKLQQRICLQCHHDGANGNEEATKYKEIEKLFEHGGLAVGSLQFAVKQFLAASCQL